MKSVHVGIRIELRGFAGDLGPVCELIEETLTECVLSGNGGPKALPKAITEEILAVTGLAVKARVRFNPFTGFDVRITPGICA
jgi:hypothetical protein